MTLLGWWIIACSAVSLAAVSVTGMISFWVDTFDAARWQIYLIYLGTVFITGKSIVYLRISNWLKDNEAAPLFVAPKSVPKITQTTLLLSVTGFIVLFCMILGLKKQTQPASFIIRSGLGTSGWSNGTAWMMGIGNAL